MRRRTSIPTRTFLIVSAGLIGGLISLVDTAAANERREPAICTITTEQTSKNQLVTLKCAKASSPRNFVIRRTIRRSEDEAGYLKLARAAGRRLTCDLTRTGRSQFRPTYRVFNCR